MNSIQNRIEAFSKLGDFLSQFSTKGIEKKENIPFNELFFDGLKHQIKLAQENNSWFTKDNILNSLESWSKSLNYNNLNNFTNRVNLNKINSKTVAIVMAGNIP